MVATVARKWSTHEDTLLRKMYLTHTRAEIASHLGRTTASVRKRCSTLQLNTKQPRWTDGDVAGLIAYCRAAGDRQVPLAAYAKQIGRTSGNVTRKALRLGLVDSTAQYATAAERGAAIGQGTRAYQAEHGHPRGALGLRHSVATRQALSGISKRMWELMTPEQRALLAERRNKTNLERYGTGGPVHLNASQPFSRCRGGRRPDLDNRYFRSAWEANYARYLNLQVVHAFIRGWEYEPQTFVFHGVTRGALSYTPDFRVTELDGSQNYREVKGWMTSQSRTRLKRMAEFYPDVEIQLVDEPVYKALARQCAGLIPNWE